MDHKISFQRFKLPLWGHAADEIPPQWLVQRMQSGELTINRLGGLTASDGTSCSAGDYVLLANDKISFLAPEHYKSLAEAA